MKTNCVVCSKEFNASPCLIKIGRGRCCSRECSSKNRQKPNSKWKNKEWLKEYRKEYSKNVLNITPRPQKVLAEKMCEECGCTFIVNMLDKNKKEKKFCSRSCYFNSPRNKYNEGTKTKANGYVMIRVPSHPNANPRGYVYEHRAVIEKEIGRFLTKDEVVHHINHNKTDNSISNLRLFETTNEHTTFHLKERWNQWKLWQKLSQDV